MPLQLFLNELSVAREQVSRAMAVARLKQLVETVRVAQSVDGSLIVYSEESLAHFPLGEGTTIASIRNMRECVEESLYLKAIDNRAPLKLAADGAGADDPNLREYRLSPVAPIGAGEVANGLGFAHFLDGLGVSLESHAYWRERVVELGLTALDMAGEIATTQVMARNADSPAAIAYHADALRALLLPTFIDGADLWTRRGELLPNLIFIPRTRAQIEGILRGDPMLEQAWIKLSGIDQAIKAWKFVKGPRPMFPFNVRAESRSRRALTEFNDAEGHAHIFSDHCDLAPTEGRIHFIFRIDPQPHALIGHVGRKLGIG